LTTKLPSCHFFFHGVLLFVLVGLSYWYLVLVVAGIDVASLVAHVVLFLPLLHVPLVERIANFQNPVSQ
jgi:hypothetical protein